MAAKEKNIDCADDILIGRHVKFFKMCLNILPNRYASLDTTRMTIAFFAISGLDVIDRLEVLDKKKEELVDWIYSLQILPNETSQTLSYTERHWPHVVYKGTVRAYFQGEKSLLMTESNIQNCGFRGSSTIGAPYNTEKACLDSCDYDTGHIAMTYTALLSLLILGDDLSGVNRAAIASGLKALQQPDGSFSATPEGSEFDMRFVYCACCVCHLIDDWSGLNKAEAVKFIRDSLTYEGAFSQAPYLEAHGGSTFCAVASLVLLGCLEETLTVKERHRLAHWCILRQQSGFQGRPNKPVDTCYSFWVGATLELLGMFELVNASCNRYYLVQTQDKLTGGFSKWPDNSPDALHAYFGACGLSLMGEPGIQPMHAALNVTMRAAQRLKPIHANWKDNKPIIHTTSNLLANESDTVYTCECMESDNSPHIDTASYSHPPISSVVISSPTDSEPVNHKHFNPTDNTTSTISTPSRKPVTPNKASVPFLGRKHVCFFQRCLQTLPSDLTVADTSRVTIVHLAVTALDLLDAVSTVYTEHDKITCWIYSLQISPKQADAISCNSGFRGSPASKVSNNSDVVCRYDCSHIAMTYSSLCSLITLRDDFSRLDRKAIITSLRHLQLLSGSFSPNAESSQTDMKFTYCAVSISYILDDWSGINTDLVMKYIKSCLTHEGGFGQCPGLEAHGGATYCAVAILVLMGELETALTVCQHKRLVRWCLQHQLTGSGFNSRTNKQPDSSYCFWIPATLQMLGSLELTDQTENERYVLSCQCMKTGGFSAQTGQPPDALHGMLSLGALSLAGTDGVSPLHAALNVSSAAYQHLSRLKNNWGNEN